MTPREVATLIERIAGAHGTTRAEVTGKLSKPHLRTTRVRAARLAAIEALRATKMPYADIGAALGISDERARALWCDANPALPPAKIDRRIVLRDAMRDVLQRGGKPWA